MEGVAPRSLEVAGLELKLYNPFEEEDTLTAPSLAAIPAQAYLESTVGHHPLPAAPRQSSTLPTECPGHPR